MNCFIMFVMLSFVFVVFLVSVVVYCMSVGYLKGCVVCLVVVF